MSHEKEQGTNLAEVTQPKLDEALNNLGFPVEVSSAAVASQVKVEGPPVPESPYQRTGLKNSGPKPNLEIAAQNNMARHADQLGLTPDEYDVAKAAGILSRPTGFGENPGQVTSLTDKQLEEIKELTNS